jgi:hypothetical protein
MTQHGPYGDGLLILLLKVGGFNNFARAATMNRKGS